MKDKQFLALVGGCVLAFVGAVWLSKTVARRAVRDHHEAWVADMDLKVEKIKAKGSVARAEPDECWSDPFFIIAVNLGQDLDDLRLCMEMAWAVCEADGEVVCGMDVRGDCGFTCCPEEDVR